MDQNRSVVKILNEIEIFIERLGLPVALGVVTFVSILFLDYTQDDVFITLTYSRNLLDGNGFVFYPGETVQGTTTPLWTLLMIPVVALTDALRTGTNSVSAIFLLLVVMFGWHLLQRGEVSKSTRFFAALGIATSPLIYVSFGMETMLVCALLLGAMLLYAQARLQAAMMIAGLLSITRSDGAVLAFTLGLLATYDAFAKWQTTKQVNWRDLPWIPSIAYFVIIAPWYLFAWAYFGTPFPQTFSAKQALFAGTLFISDGVNWLQTFYFEHNPVAWLVVAFIPFGMWSAVLRRELRPLPLWAVLYTAGYTALNVTAFWYYTPLLVVFGLLAAMGGEYIIRQLPAPMLAKGAVVVTVSLAFLGFSAVRTLDFQEAPERMNTYETVGRWIAINTPPDSSLLVRDLGIVGYYAQRRTIDTPALIVPDSTFPNVDTYAILKYQADYVHTTQFFALQQVMEREWFNILYRPVIAFTNPADYFSPQWVYVRRFPLETPTTAYVGDGIALNCLVQLRQGEPIPDETTARLYTRNEGDEIYHVTQPFMWGEYPATRAEADEIIVEQSVVSTETFIPGHYRWETSCGADAANGEVELLSLEAAPDVRMVDATWEEIAQLKHIRIMNPSTLYSGSVLELALQWEVQQPTPSALNIFAHFHAVDDPQPLAQADGIIRGEVPTTSWQTGEELVEVRQFALPLDIAPGEYKVSVGFYDLADGTRRATIEGRDSVTLPVTFAVN